MERTRELQRHRRTSLPEEQRARERKNKIEKDKEGGGLRQLLLMG